MERSALQTSSNTRRFYIVGEELMSGIYIIWQVLLQILGSFMCLPISHWNSSCHKLLRAADLACCAKGQALRILHIQNLTCSALSSIFSICVFYIMVLPRRSALIIPSLKQHAHTLEKKPQHNNPQHWSKLPSTLDQPCSTIPTCTKKVRKNSA